MEGNDRDAAKITSSDAYIEIKKAAIEKATGDAAFASYAASIPRAPSKAFPGTYIPIFLPFLLCLMLPPTRART